MGLLEIILIAVSLSMDAFAVSICNGLSMRKVHYRNAFITALFFGGFQALMPLLGWLLGKQFEGYIMNYGHWFAFILLGFIGGKMIFDAVRGSVESGESCERLDVLKLLVMAIATSMDALAVGVTFAFLKTPIIKAALIIGIITFTISFLGVIIGNRFGKRFKRKAEIAGGVLLILIGAKILFEHIVML